MKIIYLETNTMDRIFLFSDFKVQFSDDAQRKYTTNLQKNIL